jgi:curved DNA-binding protein CbpA
MNRACIVLACIVASIVLALWGPLASPCENHYSTLGVPRVATAAEIRKAWHRESLLLHPDKRQGSPLSQRVRVLLRLLWRTPLGSSADEAFFRASRAYEALSDSEAKRAYDGALAQCEDELASTHAARRTARQSFIHARTPFSLRGACALATEGLEALAARAPLAALGNALRLLSRGVDGVATWLEMHGSWQSIPFVALFFLFVGVTALPVLASALWYVATAPVRTIFSALGLTRRTDRRRDAGLKRARERQAEHFSRAAELKRSGHAASVGSRLSFPNVGLEAAS